MTDNYTKTPLPLLAVRDVVIYPQLQLALFVGRDLSIKAIETAQEEHDGLIFAVSQKDSLDEDISPDNLYQTGTVCRIVSTMPHDSSVIPIQSLVVAPGISARPTMRTTSVTALRTKLMAVGMPNTLWA